MRLGELVEFRGGYAYKSNTYVGSSNWQVVRIGNVKNDKLLLDSQPVFVPEQIGNDTIKYQIQPDDILFTMTGTKGKRDYFYSVKVPPTSTKLLLNQRVGCLRCIANVLYINYLCNVLKSTYILDTIFATETGNVSQGNIGSESTLSLYIPLPPYPEQERIVKALNELVLTLYGIDNCRGKLQETIQNAKSKILDLAMQGKLVPQDPADEPAATMLRRINPKAKIITDNPQYQQFTPPFDIPESWQWVRLDEICSIKGGKRIPRGKSFAKEKTSHAYLRVTDMKNNTIETSDLKYIDDEVFEQIKNYTINTTDLYLTIAGTIGSVGIIPPEVDGMNLTENAAKLTDISCDKVYLLYSLSSSFAQEHFSSRFHQVAQPKLSIETASSTFIPVPPLNEQKRIVAKIKELFSVLDTIEASLQS